ncbi:MAG TPA: cytochrome c oxidase assembly factor Coa1 family protein [Candidatus Cybelea sp.]|jgi:hypothetical protein|nr:cytochrome c oxidase assembly factor Coa1 family protein [Candidatus Cybelea sp.]
MNQDNRNWLGRNWKWFVPTICFAAALILVGVFFATLVFGATKIMKSSEAYRRAVAVAMTDHRVVAALGSPITEGRFVSGNISVTSSHPGTSSWHADFAIPIYGPKGKATIFVVAAQAAGKWSFTKLVVEVEGASEKIDLNEQRKKGERTQMFWRELQRNPSRLNVAGQPARASSSS